MSLFFTDDTKKRLNVARRTDPVSGFFWGVLNQADHYAASPGLAGLAEEEQWWYQVTESLTTVAWAWAIKPGDKLACWLRDATLSVARRPLSDWVGPAFRDHASQPTLGHLETAHLAMSLAVVLDLARGVFSEEEQRELTEAIEQKGMQLCKNWLDAKRHISNWRCILLMGYAVPAAVLNKAEAMEYAVQEFARCADFFQPDGSYGESLQYGNYAQMGLTYAYEALVRRDASLADRLSIKTYVQKVRWDAASYFYTKPLSGWGAYPLPRSANFADSAALYRPSADNLLHIAVRAERASPEAAGLAHWLFIEHYLPCFKKYSPDGNSFGFKNDVGFLTLPLLLETVATPLSPEEAGLKPVEAFSCGNVLARNRFGGRTILAARTGNEPLHAKAHLHGDVNSFILVHNEERLLADPGHACYRNLIRELDVATLSHNTCTFTTESGSLLQQKHTGRRMIEADGRNGEPSDNGTRLELSEQVGAVTAIVSEASRLYGEPIEEFTRIWLLCGEHALFVIDRIRASEPVRTHWSWLLNNRDGALDLKIPKSDRLVARRGNAGMKLFHVGEASMPAPQYAYMHDAYAPLPAQLGEGKPGSGLLVRWEDAQARKSLCRVHAITVDSSSAVAGWHLKFEDGYVGIIESPDGSQAWKLKLDAEANQVSVLDTLSGKETSLLHSAEGKWSILQQ